MKFPKIKLHNKIILGLLLGIIFGAVFAINKYKLEIQSSGETLTVENWQEFILLKNDTLVKTFNTNDQILIIKTAKQLISDKAKPKISAIIKLSNGNEKKLNNITYIDKIRTIGVCSSQ